MSIRVDTAPLIAGAVVVGVPGLGVLGSLIPATGEHGPGYAYDDLIAGDETREIRGLITTWPANGTLTAFEDTSFEYDGTSDTFSYQLYVDGAARGSVVTHTITIGAGASGALTTQLADATATLTPGTTASGALTTTLGNLTATLTGSTSAAELLTTLDDCTATLAGNITITGPLATTLDDCTAALAAGGAASGVLGTQLDNLTATLSGQIVVAGALNSTLQDATATLTGQVLISGALVTVLQDCTTALYAPASESGRLSVDPYIAAYYNPPTAGSATHGHDYLRLGARFAAIRERGR